VVEEGTHDELLARQGLYHSLWLQQNATDDVADPQASTP
jgi:ABC-type multidrug transport system fused ATPase/permease subunit